MTALRLWMVAFALLFSQWVFASHDHEVDHAVDESCQVCLVADHLDLTQATDNDVQILSAVSPAFTGLYSCFITPIYSSYTARAPPHFLYR